MNVRYFEDFHPGDRFSSDTIVVSREEIVAFARQFDPQPFHLDEEAARRSPYGGLIASGGHTIAIYLRLLVDSVIAGSAGMGSPGMDEVRWLRPVRPGDALCATSTVLDTVPSRSKPDRGVVRLRSEVLNQDDQVVMTLVALCLLGRRPA
jgi:acyl dehydratase